MTFETVAALLELVMPRKRPSTLDAAACLLRSIIRGHCPDLLRKCESKESKNKRKLHQLSALKQLLKYKRHYN